MSKNGGQCFGRLCKKRTKKDARMIAQMDERVNSYYRDIYYKTIDSMKANPETVVSGTDYLSVAQYLERIGDYVTNILRMDRLFGYW